MAAAPGSPGWGRRRVRARIRGGLGGAPAADTHCIPLLVTHAHQVARPVCNAQPLLSLYTCICARAPRAGGGRGEGGLGSRRSRGVHSRRRRRCRRRRGAPGGEGARPAGGGRTWGRQRGGARGLEGLFAGNLGSTQAWLGGGELERRAGGRERGRGGGGGSARRPGAAAASAAGGPAAGAGHALRRGALGAGRAGAGRFGGATEGAGVGVPGVKDGRAREGRPWVGCGAPGWQGPWRAPPQRRPSGGAAGAPARRAARAARRPRSRRRPAGRRSVGHAHLLGERLLVVADVARPRLHRLVLAHPDLLGHLGFLGLCFGRVRGRV
jgi:hypothetical protein